MDYLINHLIAGMGSFVQLFFILSGFSMCCGYYEKVKNNEIGLNKFYGRRYAKILPFFTMLVFLDWVASMVFDGEIGVSCLYETFANLTLMFGFLPVSHIAVIGVGWTLGVIFGFYILFPFFVYLIWNKKRAWISLIITVGLNYVCKVYFLSEGTAVSCNVLRWLCYFVAGGLVYLYRDEICKMMRSTAVGIIVTALGFSIVYVLRISLSGDVGAFLSTVKTLVGYTLMLSGALCTETNLWCNPVSRFISKVSLEIYLAHMMFFRVIEKLGLTAIAGKNMTSYIVACFGTIVGALTFAVVYQYIERIIMRGLSTRNA